MDFDAWVKRVFDRPLSDPVFWDDIPIPPAPVAVDYLARLFADPLPAVGEYTDAQLDQGFNYLASNCCSNYAATLFPRYGPEAAPWPARRAALRAVGDLFEKLFAVRCTPHLSWLGEPNASPLNGICYMWWDVLPVWVDPADPSRAEVEAELLEVLSRTLAIDHVACQEAALHGLGHRHIDQPADVEAIVDRFLAARTDRRPELTEYAERARDGMVQ